MDWQNILELEIANRSEVGRHLFLAQVGAVLRKHGVDVRELTQGRRLLEFLQAEAANRFLIEAQPGQEGGFYLSIRTDAARHLPSWPNAGRSAYRDDSKQSRRYLRPFWTAFIKRIPAGYKRLVQMDGLGFQDIPSDSSAGFSGIEITPDDLANSDLLAGEDMPKAVMAAIENWTKSKGISPEQFLLQSEHHVHKPSAGLRERWLSSLAGLSEHDQRRITIPLDIILKLLSGS